MATRGQKSSSYSELYLEAVPQKREPSPLPSTDLGEEGLEAELAGLHD